jgi:hypothetical protein
MGRWIRRCSTRSGHPKARSSDGLPAHAAAAASRVGQPSRIGQAGVRLQGSGGGRRLAWGQRLGGVVAGRQPSRGLHALDWRERRLRPGGPVTCDWLRGPDLVALPADSATGGCLQRNCEWEQRLASLVRRLLAQRVHDMASAAHGVEVP